MPTDLWQRRNEISSPPSQLVSKLPIKKHGSALKTLKGSHRMGDGPIKKKTSTPHSLMTTYRMNLISAKSILDSTFKRSVVTHVCSSSYPSSQYVCPYNYLSVCLSFFKRNLRSTKYTISQKYTKDFAKYRESAERWNKYYSSKTL